MVEVRDGKHAATILLGPFDSSNTRIREPRSCSTQPDGLTGLASWLASWLKVLSLFYWGSVLNAS